ncbi:MAG: tyrosine-type recombinase/integrase [Limnohabitans sp.]|nr:tyrosine-type recombinase/integrase [Limnohabitans sp.]
MTLEEYLHQKYKPSTIETLLYNITNYQKHITNHQTAQLKDILRYIKILREQDKKPKNIHGILYAIKVYYNYLQQSKKRKDHPCKKLQLQDKIDKSIRTEKLYSTKELDYYLEQTKSYKKLMVSLLVYQGLTVKEITTLQVHQINIEKAEITLTSRELPLNAKQIYLLLEYLKNKDKKPTDLLFTTRTKKPYRTREINDYINFGRNENLKITPLKIRQSLIKNLLETNDIRVVQVFAGHKKSSTTQQYKTTQFEELKAKITLLHPLQ